MNTFNLTPWGDKTVLQNSLKVAKKFGAHNVQCPVTASEWPHCSSSLAASYGVLEQARGAEPVGRVQLPERQATDDWVRGLC